MREGTKKLPEALTATPDLNSETKLILKLPGCFYKVFIPGAAERIMNTRVMAVRRIPMLGSGSRLVMMLELLMKIQTH